MNGTKFRLVHNQNKNYHYDYIPFNLKEVKIYIYKKIHVHECTEKNDLGKLII